MYLLIETTPNQSCLYLYDDQQQLAQTSWPSDRQLSDQILQKLTQILKTNQTSLKDLSGLGVFAGPGYFTALRISHVLANTLAYGLAIPVVNAQGRAWINDCLRQLKSAPKKSQEFRIVTPSYGQSPQITTARK